MLQSFLTVGQQILTLYLLLVVGFVLGKVKLLDDRASVALSSLVMYVVSPCMMVVAFQRPLEHTALHNFGVVTGVSAVLHVVFIAAAMLLIRDRDRERQNCLRFAAVFSNCGFMGYPLMAALLGSIGVFYGSAYVIVFTILSWTWGVYVITGDRSQLRLKPLLLNPGVISVVLAMALYLGQVTVPEPLMVPINYLADLNTPLPMLVVGYQLSHANFKAALQGISSWVTLVLRLLVLPLTSLGICLALNVSHDLTLVLLIAASAPRRAAEYVRRPLRQGHRPDLVPGVGPDGDLRVDHAGIGRPGRGAWIKKHPPAEPGDVSLSAVQYGVQILLGMGDGLQLIGIHQRLDHRL